MQETWAQSLGWEDPLEKGKATHFSIRDQRSPWTIQSMGSQSQTQLSDFHFKLFQIPYICVNMYLFLFSKSRKVVLMNLLSGKEWRRGSREWTYGHNRRSGWNELRKQHRIYTVLNVKQIAVGSCCVIQGAQMVLLDDLDSWDEGRGYV